MPDKVYYVLEEDSAVDVQLALFKSLQLEPLPINVGNKSLCSVVAFQQGSLSVRELCDKESSATRVDFSAPSFVYRLTTSGRKQGLAKAVGLNKQPGLEVVDATAGLGKDAFVLASLGAKVTMLERSGLVHALLENGLQLATQSSHTLVNQTAKSLALHHCDALSWFKKIQTGEQDKPDVIYLDPMFPNRLKSAKVKKDIACLHDLLGADVDVQEVLSLARQCVKRRVVLKSPTGKEGEQFFSEQKPDYFIEGKSVRFAVFLAKQ